MLNLEHVEIVEQVREAEGCEPARSATPARLPNLLAAIRRRKQVLEVPTAAEYPPPPSVAAGRFAVRAANDREARRSIPAE